MIKTIITRQKQYALPGQNRLFSWKWLYHINDSHTCDTLSQARDIAKRLYPETEICEAWKLTR